MHIKSGATSMKDLYDHKAPKKPTNLSINSDLLNKSKSLNINLSATLEEALSDILASKAVDEWKKQNAKAIFAYNDLVEQYGCFGDSHRSF
jgi:antitoxin CcdA